MDDTYNRLTSVFRQVFDDDELVIGPQTSASDVDAWDSINHVNLIIAVEREFKVRLRSSEVADLKNVGELARLLESKTKKP